MKYASSLSYMQFPLPHINLERKLVTKYDKWNMKNMKIKNKMDIQFPL